jgi:DNA repair protein RadC
VKSPSVHEQIRAYGGETLSNKQIIDLLLPGMGPGQLDAWRPDELISMSGQQLMEECELTKLQASRIVALGEFVRRCGAMSKHACVNSPRLAGEYLLPKARGLTEEVFGVVCLNSRARIISDRIISKGTSTGTLVGPREVLREALLRGAVSVLVWHNHPSGDPSPSREDISLTKRIRSGCEAIGVPLADHIIVGADTYHSFRASEGWDVR